MLNYNVVFLFLHVLITKYVVCVSVNSALMSDLYPLAWWLIDYSHSVFQHQFWWPQQGFSSVCTWESSHVFMCKCAFFFQMMDEEATKRYLRTGDDGQNQAEVPTVQHDLLTKHDNLWSRCTAQCSSAHHLTSNQWTEMTDRCFYTGTRQLKLQDMLHQSGDERLILLLINTCVPP